jgi:hypothetical protein
MTDPREKDRRGRVDLPIYPRAFVAAAKLCREKNRVFVAMPFEASHSRALWKLVQSVCKVRNLEPRRADSSQYPRAIVADILEELETAEIIIADLTGLNPNVLYELGIAHVRCDSVVLLCERGQALPFDLASIRCLFYDLDTFGGKREFTHKEEFAKRVGRTVDALRQPAKTTVLESALDRTRSVVADLELLADRPDEELSSESIWFSGHLSSFAIGENEYFDPGEEEFRRALLAERDCLIRLARRGCPTRCIVSPPSKDHLIVHRLPYAVQRLRTLIAFLESGDPALNHIDWVISPYGQKNSYIIGHISYFEGFKAGLERGFALTLRQDEPEAIRSSIELHKKLFERLRTDTLVSHSPPGHHTNEREALRHATTQCLKRSLRFCNSVLRSKRTKSPAERYAAAS